MPKSLVVPPSRRAGSTAVPVPHPESDRLSAALLVAGAALAVVGWTDAALLWYPFGFGNPEWEFATASSFFDALPLGTIGLVVLALGALSRGSTGVLRLLRVAFPALVALFVAAFVLFVLNAVVAWNRVDPALHVMLDRAILKTTVVALTYLALYAWLWTLVRRAAPARRPTRS